VSGNWGGEYCDAWLDEPEIGIIFSRPVALESISFQTVHPTAGSVDGDKHCGAFKTTPLPGSSHAMVRVECETCAFTSALYITLESPVSEGQYAFCQLSIREYTSCKIPWAPNLNHWKSLSGKVEDIAEDFLDDMDSGDFSSTMSNAWMYVFFPPLQYALAVTNFYVKEALMFFFMMRPF
jgi:hypothetical protein